MKIALRHKDTGVVKQLKSGFSWTFLFFGALVYIFRGNWSEFFKCFFFTGITLGIYQLVQCWTANKKELVRYMERGYIPVDQRDAEALSRAGIIIAA